MNTLGAGLATFRPAAETPTGRTGRGDGDASAFGALLGAFAEEGAPGAQAVRAEPDEEPAPPGDASAALTILAAFDAAAASAAGSAAKPLSTLFDQTVPLAEPGAVPTQLRGPEVPPAEKPDIAGLQGGLQGHLQGRLQVSVLSQETHFAPVKPHPVTLIPVLPEASASPLGSFAADLPAAQWPVPASGPDGSAAKAIDGSPEVWIGPPSLRPQTAADGIPTPVGKVLALGPGAVDPTMVRTNSPRPDGAGTSVPEAGGTKTAVPSASAIAAPPAPSPTPAPPSEPMRADPSNPVFAATAGSAAAPMRGQSPRVADDAPQAAEAASSRDTGRPTPAPLSQGRGVSPVTAGGRPETAQAASSRDAGHPVPPTSPQASPAAPAQPASQASRLDDRSERRIEIAQSAAVETSSLAAPASAAAPIRQVAEAVVAEVGRLPGSPAFAAQPGADGPLRILTIQLRPDDLGTVVVRMRLRGDQLEMSLHASREETAALLRSDGAALDDLLRSAGYQPETVTITSARSDGSGIANPSRGDAQGSSFQGSSSQGGQGGDPRHASSDQSGRRQPEPRDADRAGTQKERTGDEAGSIGPGRFGRYL